MADKIKELIESLAEFEGEMEDNLNKFKYDDTLEKYFNLRLKFKNLYDNDIKLNSKAHDVIVEKRNVTKYVKNDEALERIKELGSITGTKSSSQTPTDNIIQITPTTEVRVVTFLGDDKYTFNGIESYNIDQLYSLNVGVYLFKNIPEENPIAFLVNDTDHPKLIKFYGEKRVLKFGHKTPGRFRLEEFYYGDVVVQVKGDFKKVSIFSYYNGYIGLTDTFRYSPTSTMGYNLSCLRPRVKVSVSSDFEGYKYTLNGLKKYSRNRRYGVDIGVYIFEDVPKAHPIAILNTRLDNSALITYKGDYMVDKKEHVKENLKLDKNYPGTILSEFFYWGNVEVKVTGNFGMASIFSYYHGYMGGEDLLIYSDECPRPS